MEPVTEEMKQELIRAGYEIKSAFDGMVWAVTPEGFSLTRGPIDNETSAWEHCQVDYLWKLEK